MLSVRPPPPPPPPLLPLPLQPAIPAANHANSSSPAAAYPSRAHFRCSRAACCARIKNKIASPAAIHNGTIQIRGPGCGLAIGTNCDSAVVSVAVQNAFPVVEAIPDVGEQFTALPRLLAPFLNCTVPVGPAPLLLVEIVAVSVTLPPEVIVATLEVTTAVVVAFVIVTLSAVDVLAL